VPVVVMAVIGIEFTRLSLRDSGPSNLRAIARRRCPDEHSERSGGISHLKILLSVFKTYEAPTIPPLGNVIGTSIRTWSSSSMAGEHVWTSSSCGLDFSSLSFS